MKSPVANCSVMYATSTFLIVLIYNIPPTKSETNENIKRAHYRSVSYVNDECVPAIKSHISWLGTGWIHALTYHNHSRYKISTRRNLRNGPVEVFSL